MKAEYGSLEEYPLNTHTWEEFEAPSYSNKDWRRVRCKVCGEVMVSPPVAADSLKFGQYFVSHYSLYGNSDLTLRNCSERLMMRALE